MLTIVHLLVEYFASRLENQEQIENYGVAVKETATVLTILAQMKPAFLKDDAPLVARAIFNRVLNNNAEGQKPSTRLVIFQLIEFLHSDDQYNMAIFKQLTPRKFVDGLVSMAEHEKDPKCLRILFRLYERVSADWANELDHGSLESIHDSFMRYYPITLKDPSIKDSSLPTREELKEDLRRCITSNGYYGKHVFPRLIEAFEISSDLSADNKVCRSTQRSLN